MLINIQVGPKSVPVSVQDGSTVAEVRVEAAKHVNFESDAQAFVIVDGERPVLISTAMEATTVVTTQSTVEFVKEQGAKGNLVG